MDGNRVFAAALAELADARARPDAMAHALAIAGDVQRDMPVRCVALALASLLAEQLPIGDVDAIFDDDLLIDAAIAHGAGPALTALARELPQASLRYLGVRLVAKGEHGVHVAALLARAGDADRAAHAFAAAMEEATRLGADRTIEAVAQIVMRSADACPAMTAPLRAALAPELAARYAPVLKI